MTLIVYTFFKEQFSNTSIIAAKVPLLKIQDPQTKMLIELNIGNTVGIRNTHLLKCYADRKLMKKFINCSNMFNLY